MSRTRTRAAGGLATLALAATALVGGLPASAADSPEAAVDQLVEVVTSGDFTALDQIVCESQTGAVRAQFDIATSLGIPAEDGEAMDALTFRIEDAASELIEEAPETARVRLTGTLRIAMETDSIRDLVRRILEAEGTTVSEDDLDLMVPMMERAFSQSQPIDEVLELTLEDGAWLICGGIGTEPEDPAAVEPSVSFEGLCGLVPLTEINALGEPDVTFDSSGGADQYCTFSSSSGAELHTLTISYSRGGSIEDYRSFLPDGTDLSVAGQPAYAPEGQLLVEVAEGIFQVTAYLGEEPPEGLDPVAYLSAIAELYVPVLPQIVETGGSEGGQNGTAADEATFCDSMTIEQLNELTNLAFDETSGGPGFCSYSSTDPESFYLVSTSLDSIELDDFKVFLPDGEELTVADLPAYSMAGGQLWVGIPDTGSTLSVTALIDAALEGEDVDSDEVAKAVAELLVPTILAELASADEGG